MSIHINKSAEEHAEERQRAAKRHRLHSLRADLCELGREISRARSEREVNSMEAEGEAIEDEIAALEAEGYT